MKLKSTSPAAALNRMAKPEPVRKPRQCTACLRVTDDLDQAGHCTDRERCEEWQPAMFPIAGRD